MSEDLINHPSHYNSSKAECSGCEKQIECIDITRHMGFNLGNIIKYLWRAEHKNGVEDLLKAQWYLNDLIKNKQIPKQSIKQQRFPCVTCGASMPADMIYCSFSCLPPAL